MSGHHRWLRQQLAHWQTDGLVDEAAAQRILARYPEGAERGWGRIIFSALGAVLVGLGVILFFAYNRQAIPKAAKLALVFGALAAAYAAAMALAHGVAGVQREWGRRLARKFHEGRGDCATLRQAQGERW